MIVPLRALLVQEEGADHRRLLLELGRGGYDAAFERVADERSFRRALDEREWDVVLSASTVPGFGALEALAVLAELDRDTPLVVVSGEASERFVADLCSAGARDVVEIHRPARLAAAISREVGEAVRRAEHRRLEAQLVASDRMVVVGTLVAGVAHEVNNPLASLIGNLDLVLLDLSVLERGTGETEASRSLREAVRDAQLAADRIRTVVRDLGVFSSGGPEEVGPVDPARVMESTLRLAWNEIRHRAAVVRSYGDTPAVLATESRLGQVLLNLVMNAVQALPEGETDRNLIRVGTRREGVEVVIEVSDNGTGMPPELLQRLFSPFVTTKPAGAGMGLGLSICRRIVTDFGGRITVQSRVGHGTTFTVALPTTAAEAEVDLPAPELSDEAPRRARVLVVDDEWMILKVVQRTLARDHEVDVTPDARDALDRVARGERFDLVLCDLMMPSLSGMELHAELLRVAPDQADAMLFLTGGAFSQQADAFLRDFPGRTLEKPFDGVRLRAFVNGRIG